MAKADTTDNRDELDDKDPLDREWRDTDHDRVYYAKDHRLCGRGEYEVAVQIAEAFPEWEVVITIGPYRSYNVAFEIRPDYRAIHLDFYLIRPGSEFVAEVTKEIHNRIKELREEEVIDEV